MKVNIKKKFEKKKCVWLLATMLVAIFIITLSLIHSYAYQYRFEHDSDKIDMLNNSVTYKYYDNEDEQYRDKTYAITDEWLHRMIVRNQPLDNDWDSNPIATDTTIYGPYTWIPAGKYVITFDLTDEGGHAFQYWDVGVNFGNGSCGQQDWDASYSQSHPLVVGDNGATIYNSHYWRDSSGAHLQYTINTTGDTADYEFRLFFSSSLGNDIPFNGTGNMSIKKDFLNSVKIEAETANTISFNADGGTVNGKTTGTLTSTYWGKSREKVSVPTKDGYTFMGWYGYSKATNTTSRRSGLTFDKNSEKIKLWNADGTPAIKTEVSYNDYTVYAVWKPNYNLEVNWDSGVSYVKGTDIDGNTITINEGDSYEYHYNYAAPTYIYLKEGYAVDYITETSDNNHKWTDTTKNDTLGRWENRWTMNKDRTIYIHTKIADDYGSLTLDGDEGVEKIDGFTKGQTKIYKKGTKVTYKFKVKDGYELNYISEGTAHYSATKLNNDKDGYNYSDFYNINGNRSGYIHTKPASYTLIIDPDGGEMYNGNTKTSSVFTTKFLYGRKTYIGNSYTDKYGYLDYENNTPTREGYTFEGWKFSNGTGGLNSDGSEFFFGEIAADEDTTYDDDDIYIFNGDYAGDVTATAQWTKEATKTAYLKTFSGKGISGTNYATGGNINIGTEVTVTATVKTGYKFVNWTDGSSNEKSTDKDYKFTMPANDVNLTANATPIKYNIVFNSNKPSSATSSVTGSTASMNNIAYDTSITLNKNGYSLSGWKFAGWNNKADDSGTSYTDGQSVNNLTTTDGATITMYAKWVQGDGDLVTANKGTGISDTTGTGTYKDGASVSLGAIVATGYTWKANESTTGWFDSTGKKVSSNQNYKFTMTPGAKTYTAKATANTYTVKYNKNKADASGTITDSTYTYDVKGALRTNVFTATGYKQTGWNTKADGSGAHYDAGKAIDVINWTDLDGKVINLYAEWEKQSYAVTYIDVVNNKNGKELGRTTKQISYGSKVSGSDIGTDKTLGTYYDGYVYESCTSATVETSGTVVYRIFKVHNYNISYNLNGGSLPDGKSNPDTYNVESSDITLNNPVKSGYVFTGWSGTDITGVSTKVTIAKGSTGDRTYVANWKAAEYTIRYTRGNTDVVKEYIDQKVTYDSDVITKPGNTFTGRTYSITYDQGYTNNREWEKTSLPSDITNAHLTFKSWSISGREYNAGIKLTKPNFVTNGTVIATADWNTADIKLTGVTRAGYTFTGWKCSEDGNIYAAGTTYRINTGTTALNITFTAQWTANKDTKYVVRHWKQKLYLDGTKKYADGSRHDTVNYFLADTDNLTGTTDTLVKPLLKSYEGFTSPSVQTVTVKGDGSLIVDYYYTRNKYKIDDGDKKGGSDDGSDTDSDKGNGIEDITGGGEYYYEEEVTMEAAVKKGYHWHIDDDCHTDRSKYPTGWKVTKAGCGIDKFIDNTSYATQKIKFIMPSHDVCVKADATNNSYTIKFDNNGGTGNMQEVAATYKVPVTLPVNTFTRTTNFGESRFLYWEDRKNDVTYLNNATVTSLTDEFNGIVTLYASWDDCPEITAQERWFTVDDSQNNKITLEELLSTAKVTDDRDEDITDKLTVKYYHPNNFNQFKTDGYIMVTYTATDSSDNTTEVTVKVNIVDTVAVEQEKNTYVRFIGPDYYKESFENGGLEEDSIWKKNTEYAATLERAMENRRSMSYSYRELTGWFGVTLRARNAACDTRDHLVEKWVFTHEDVLAAKEYINEHGIGNMKEADALSNFRTQFAHCRKQ
mgnify:CR=1 FL=1